MNEEKKEMPIKSIDWTVEVGPEAYVAKRLAIGLDDVGNEVAVFFESNPSKQGEEVIANPVFKITAKELKNLIVKLIQMELLGE